MFIKKNSIQAEILGHAYFYSLNYERIIFNKSRLKTAVQVGISLYPSIELIHNLWLFPVVINELVSFDKHHIEMGVGYMFFSESKANLSDTFASEGMGLFTGRIGYPVSETNRKICHANWFYSIFDYYGIKYWEGYRWVILFNIRCIPTPLTIPTQR
ncbi:MAG: hypothetical protein R2750_14695 [Bacteroidales bacterium]